MFKPFRQLKLSGIMVLLILLVTQTLTSQTGLRETGSELNLRNKNLIDHPEPLRGDWEFYWNELLPPGTDFSEYKAEIITVPDAWNKKNSHPIYGYGTYRTTVLLPPGPEILGMTMEYSFNHYKLYVNGRLLHQNGLPGTEWVINPKNQKPEILLLPRASRLEIVLLISNYYDFNGGLLDSPVIGSMETLTLQKNRSQMRDAFLFGVFLVIGILYFLFFVSEGEDSKSSLYFGLFAMVLAIRTILYGQHILLSLLPNLPVEIEASLGHLSFYLSVPLFLRFISLQFPFKHSRIVEYPFYGASAFFSLLAITTRHHVYVRLLSYYQILALLIAVIIFAVLIIRTVRKDPAAIITLLGFIILVGSSLNDMLYAQQLISSFYMVPLGLGLFIMGQATLLSWKIGKSFRETRDLSKALNHTNKSFRRFVPEEFLTYLNRNSIIDIQLGDHVQMDMTILFMDIRDFTSLSEKMTPRENFLFLNSYYERVCPVIRENRGFIDKYMGDGIMALFAGPDSAVNATQAAIQMRQILKVYNEHRSNTGYDSLRVGIGIHTGSLMMGTIGENQRMDGTVISDAVNLCSRIESLTKEYGLDIAMSEETYKNLESDLATYVRFIGKIKVKGKEIPVSIYELFNGDLSDITDLKLKTKEEFERAVRLRDSHDFDAAHQCFKNVLKDFPGDKTTQIYLSRFRKSDR